MAAVVDLSKVGANQLKHAVSGEGVELATLWKDQPCVLLFLRRLGCQVCRWVAKETSRLKEPLDRHGVRLIGVAPETVGLKEFLEGNFFSGELYLDETKQCSVIWASKGLHLPTCVTLTWNSHWIQGRYNALSIVPAALSKPVREVVSKANAEGIHGNFSGDLLQSGGALIVSQGGKDVLLYFVQESPGDHLPLDTILKTLDISANVEGRAIPQCTDEVCTR